MARGFMRTTVVLAAILGLLGESAAAPKTCNEADALADVNATALLGEWYEIARNPANPNVNCVNVKLQLDADNSTLWVMTTFANDPSAWYKNQTATAKVPLNDLPANNVVHLEYNSTALPNSSLKLLETDYKNYVLACGYTNASDPGTSYGMVLSRDRMVSNSTLQPWIADAIVNFTNFQPDMPMVVQSDLCRSGASMLSAPVTAAILTLFYALRNLISH